MASVINAATAFVTIRLERGLFRRELQGANQQLNDLALGVARVGGAFLTMGIVATGALVKITKSASDAVEAANRFNQVFRSAGSGAATAWAESFANSVGRARTEVKDTLSTFQGFFVGLGFGADKAETFSRRLTSASVDFASFNNIADDDALRRFIGALSGSPETLDKFGFNVREAAVNQELLAMGIKKTTRTATEQQKAVAKMNIILRTMGKLGAAGDAIRTADEYANVLKRLRSTFSNLTETLGAQVIPSMKSAASGLIGMLTETEKLAKAFPGLGKSVFYAATAFTALGAALITAAVAIQAFNILGTVQALRTFGGVIVKLFAPLRALASLIGGIAGGISTLGFAVIIAGIIEMGRQTYKALGYWKDMKVAIAEASEAAAHINSLQDDRIEKNERNIAGDGDPLAGKNAEKAKKAAMLADLKKKEEDYSRRIENMQKHGRERGGFLYEMGRGLFGPPQKAVYDKETRQMRYEDVEPKPSYDKEELDREKRNLATVRRQIERMELEQRGVPPEEKKKTSEDIVNDLKAGQKEIQDRKDAAQKVIWLRKKAADARNKAAKKAGEDAGKALSKFMQKGIDRLTEASERAEGVWGQAADELGNSRDRLDELERQTTESRGAFGSLSGANIMRTGGVFGMQSAKEQKELQSRIKAAKAIMDMFEKKYGKDWKAKVERDKENAQMFETLMTRLGAI